MMIELKKLNGETLVLNALYIEQIQSLPDTTITLLNGKKMVVQTSEKELVKMIHAFYQSIGLIGLNMRQMQE